MRSPRTRPSSTPERRVADVVALEFESPAGELLRFEWDEERLAKLQPTAESEPVWQLAGELDWDEVERVRVLSARLEDGRVIAIVGLRPTGAEGHGDELTVGLLGSDGSVSGLDESLLSTEYGPDGLPRRIGLELYATEGSLPLRIAGEVTAVSTTSNGGVDRISAALTLAGAGTGAASLDLLSRA